MKDFIVINGEKTQISNGILDLGWKKKKILSKIAEFEKLKHLKGLILRGNDLESIPDSHVHLTSLKLLNIAGNPLKKLPECISELKNRGVTIYC